MITRTLVCHTVAAILALMLTSCGRNPPEGNSKETTRIDEGKPVSAPLPSQPIGNHLTFGIYWTQNPHDDADASLNRAEGIVTVIGDGSPPSRVKGLSYQYELGDAIRLVPGDGRKVEAAVLQGTKAVVLKVFIGEGLSDPASYCAFLVDAEGQVLASKEFSTMEPKTDYLKVPLVLSNPALKPDSTVRLVVTEANSDKGFVISLSVRTPSTQEKKPTGETK